MTGFDSKRQMAADKLQEPEREALKLALEALENAIAVRHGKDCTKFVNPLEPNAIAAIKEALAQPAQEPVAWRVKVKTKLRDGSLDEGYQLRNEKLSAHDEPLYTKPQQGQQSCDKREWVGLTPEETSGFTQHEMTVVKYVSKVLQEKNG